MDLFDASGYFCCRYKKKDLCIATNFRAKQRKKKNVFQKIVIGGIVCQILIKPT